jgi:hypothetical protein
MPLRPERIIPDPLAGILTDIPYWFVIGGNAVRCFCPYRPTRDVDFGVESKMNLKGMIEHLSKRGKMEIMEKSGNTVHLKWNDIKVSIFVLNTLVPFVEEKRLSVTGILATKLHAILDRGVRRDFFDLYVILQDQHIGLAECFAALRSVYSQPVPESLLLRALTYFDDAEREAPLPGEGKKDWALVKEFFLSQAGSLLMPPARKLAIQSRRVDVGA